MYILIGCPEVVSVLIGQPEVVDDLMGCQAALVGLQSCRGAIPLLSRRHGARWDAGSCEPSPAHPHPQPWQVTVSLMVKDSKKNGDVFLGMIQAETTMSIC